MVDNENCFKHLEGRISQALQNIQSGQTHTISQNKSTIKNFREDDLRNSFINKTNLEFCDIKSEISEGRRIDLDEDDENYFDYNNNGKK